MTQGQFRMILKIQAATGVKFQPGIDQAAAFICRYHRNPTALVFAHPAPVLRFQRKPRSSRYPADGD